MKGLVEFTIIPIGTNSTSVSKYVKFIHNFLKDKQINFEPNSMGTVLEGNIENILQVIVEINKKLAEKGLKRIATSIKIDYRIDKESTIKSKMNSIR